MGSHRTEPSSWREVPYLRVKYFGWKNYTHKTVIDVEFILKADFYPATIEIHPYKTCLFLKNHVNFIADEEEQRMIMYCLRRNELKYRGRSEIPEPPPSPPILIDIADEESCLDSMLIDDDTSFDVISSSPSICPPPVFDEMNSNLPPSTLDSSPPPTLDLASFPKEQLSELSEVDCQPDDSLLPDKPSIEPHLPPVMPPPDDFFPEVYEIIFCKQFGDANCDHIYEFVKANRLLTRFFENLDPKIYKKCENDFLNHAPIEIIAETYDVLQPFFLF